MRHGGEFGTASDDGGEFHLLSYPLDNASLPAYPSFTEPYMLFISSGEDLMTFHVFLFLFLFFLMLSLVWLCRLSVLHCGLAHWRVRAKHSMVRRLLKLR